MHYKRMRNTLLLVLAIFLFSPGQAQIVDRTKDRAERKTNQRIDRKIDGGIDKGLDAIEGLFKKKKKNDDKEEDVRGEEPAYEERSASEAEANADAQRAMMNLFGGGGDVDVQDSYKFNNRFLLNVKTYEKGDKLENEQHMTMMIHDTGGNFGMEVENEGVKQYMVFDLNTGEMITLISAEGQKMGMTMKLNEDFMSDDESMDSDMKPATFKKTGATKTISGYKCDEYLMEGGDLKSHEKVALWVTEEQDVDWMKAMVKMSSQNKKLNAPDSFRGTYPEGTVIQSVTEDTRSGEKTVMTVEKMEKGNFEISTAGYRFMSMGNMQGN